MPRATNLLCSLALPAVISGAVLSSAASADSIGLVLQPAAPTVRAGSIVEVRLLVRKFAQGPWAAPQAQSFLALDAIVGWDPTKLQFLGVSSTGAIPMLFSYLPAGTQDYTGLNEANPPRDGDLFYTGATPLGQARNVSESDARVTTFRFQALAGNWTSADITLIPDRTVATYTETVVYDGTVPGLGVTGPLVNATVTQEFPSTWYRDADGDGFGTPNTTQVAFDRPTGFVAQAGDCNDSNAAIKPGAAENCANLAVDDDCDGDTSADEASDSGTYYADGDSDGYGAGPATKYCTPPSGWVANNQDCNDASAAVRPAAVENCANLGVDNDCDGVNDAAEAIDSVSYHVDGDGDGFGAGAATKSCSPIAGSVTNNSDCDDTRFLYADTDGDGIGAGAAAACGVASNSDNCPSVANADQANLDGDSTGDACDPDVDGDGVANANDAFPRDAAQSAATAALSESDLGTFLGGASGAVVNAGSMSSGQLGVVLQNLARISSISSLTVTSAMPETDIAALLAKTAAGEATAVATGMNAAQLTAVAGAPAAVGSVNGVLAMGSSQSAIEMQLLLSRLSRAGVANIDPQGLATDQQQALRGIGTLAVRSQAVAPVGGEIVIPVDAWTLMLPAVGASVTVNYDAAKLEFLGALGGDDMPVLVSASDNGSSVLVMTAIAQGGSGSTPIAEGNLAKLRFRPKVSFCGALDCVGLSGGSAVNTLSTGQSVPPSVPCIGMRIVRATAMDMPALAGVPSNVTVPADAGTVAGAVVSQAVVSASNACGSVPVTLSVALAGGGSASSWPASFPVGASVVTWRAEDAAGNVKTEQATVTVQPFQLATIDVRLAGAINGPSGGFVQQLRVRLSSGDVVLKDVQFSSAGVGSVTDVEVPVAAGYSCISVKDAAHTLASADLVPVSGTKYVPAQFTLVSGDANDDNLVDILDFGVFVTDWGGPRLPTARSNYNRDGAVNSGDFTFISSAFLQQGAQCGGAYSGGAPRDRISVRDLRRMGLGELAVADFNRDGWVDTTDVSIFMKRGMQQPAGAPVDRISGGASAD
jgi:hypothetical protein